MPESQKVEAALSRTDVAVSKEASVEETLNAPGRRLSESRMRENRSAELTTKPHVRVRHEARSSSGFEPTLSHRRMNLTRQAEGQSNRPSEALETRPEPPSLEERWQAEVESR